MQSVRCNEALSDILVLMFVGFLQSYEDMESPAVLVKSFQALQEERVHTYNLFDEYVYLFINMLINFTILLQFEGITIAS